MKRAFLFGLTAQLLVIGAIFLLLDDLMLPMTRSPLIGVIALVAAAVAAYFAWSAAPHPTWPAAIGMWFAGFFAIYVLIPFAEIIFVLFIPLFSR